MYKSSRKYEDGIVGLHNNTFFCYMNACLQCLLPIEELRDHFIEQQYRDFRALKCRKNNQEFC